MRNFISTIFTMMLMTVLVTAQSRTVIDGLGNAPSLVSQTGSVSFDYPALTSSLAFGGYNNGSYGLWIQGKYVLNNNQNLPLLLNPLGGNVGVGTATPSSRFEVNGLVHSTSGGYKFPDGTLQTTAAGATQFDVKAYGATGNDTSDDYSAFFNAKTAAEEAGGGTLFVPPGAYDLGTSLYLPANVSIKGAGMGTTIIRAKSGTSLGLMVEIGDHARIEDLTLDGNRANSSTAEALQVGGDHTLVNHVEIKNAQFGLAWKNGVNDSQLNKSWVHHNSAGVLCFGGIPCTNILIDGNLIEEQDGGGAGLNTVHMTFSHNTVKNNHNNGGQILGGTVQRMYRDWMVIGNHFIVDDTNTLTCHIEWEDTGISVIGNDFSGAHSVALVVTPTGDSDAGDALFSGNLINSGYGVLGVDTAETGKARNVIITGNFATANVVQAVRIGLHSTPTWTIAGNDFHLAATPFVEAVPNTAIRTGNRGIIDADVNGVSRSSGTGAPTFPAVNGSTFSRTDGTGSSLYARKAGDWVPLN